MTALTFAMQRYSILSLLLLWTSWVYFDFNHKNLFFRLTLYELA